MRSHSHLNTSRKIIQAYDGRIPLASWLKQFFKTDKKFGSKDRKQIAHACYCYYRLGNAFNTVPDEERMIIALFLCFHSPSKLLEEVRPGWNEKMAISLGEKIKLLSAEEEIRKIFPFTSEISNEIDVDEFNLSFLIQPDLYLRLRPGKKKKVMQQLEDAGLVFTLLEGNCIQLSNQSKIDEILAMDEDVVVQDYNSQKTIGLLEDLGRQLTDPELSAWDCCAASGGKSILFHDHFPGARLSVSDLRESILINLQKRFKRAGIKNYSWFVADVSRPDFSIQKKFDVVICDAPCSGSGTWSRTPEQLHFFRKEKINEYATLQKKIVSNAAKALKKNSFFLYITCSVFKKENEEVVDFMQKNLSLQLRSMKYLKGYDKKADTLFAALFSAL